MASNGTIAHRFANKNYNFERGLKGSSTHIDGRNYYSYSTVFGQWVDEKVCVVYLGSTSVTSCKHQLGRYCFPKDVVVLPYDDGGSSSYYGGGWHGCKLLGWGEDFKLSHRWELMDYWMSEIYKALETINGGKKKDLDGHAAYIIGEYWPYMEKLCSLYKDTTIPKYIKRCDKKYKKLVKALKDGEREVSTLVDIVFGEGTYKAYYDYCGRYRKSADKRAKVEALCKRLGIASPYESDWRGGRMDSGLTADQIRKLTAKERNELHFASIMSSKQREEEKERTEKYYKNFRNAYKWIVGYEPKKRPWGGGYEDGVENNCVNKYNGVVYECSGTHGMYDSFDWIGTIVRFSYDDFRKSEDKDEWIANFYKKCEYAAMLRRAYNIFKRVNAHFEERSCREKKFLDDDYLRENTSESEYEVCKQYIALQDKHYADEEARERAARIEMERRREEERKEKELQEQLKQEQIDKCLQRGLEGRRDLWRQHYMTIHDAERYNDSRDDSEFFFGGNVLMRFSMNKDKIETSKSIRITIPACKVMWKLVSKWHNNPASFKPMTIKTLDGTYTISSYEDDILTAGCHDIAYAEMERMYNEIVELEKSAA